MKNLKQSTLLLIGLLLLASTSCKKELASTTGDTGFASNAEKIKLAATSENQLSENTESISATKAQVYKYHTTIDLSDPRWREFNACTGGNINIIRGIWHIDFMYIINRNRFTLIDHSNVSNYKLINLTTGIEYTGSYVSNTSFTGSVTSEYPIRITGTLKILLTTPGGGNNGILFVNYATTINANGEVTVDFYNQRAGCQ